ncbi:carboxypeptidase B-like [Centruroides vittatus]|uniref:carboxypeptidase B-like n=1 Tax=Centruroides vittatus TaxID=120091 RepID=UPI00350ED76E
MRIPPLVGLLVAWCALRRPPPVRGRQNFTGHRLLTAVPGDTRELDALKALTQNFLVDFWIEPGAVDENVTLRLSPQLAGAVERYLESRRIRYHVLTEDLQRWIDREREENRRGDSASGRDSASDFEFDVYHPPEEINGYLDELESRFGNLTSVRNIGTTFEGKSIRLVKIRSPGPDKPAVWIDAGIHSREWVSPATGLYLVERLLSDYGHDPVVTQLVDTFDWYLVPLVNPDGYEYTWQWNRLWRKNRAISRILPGLIVCRGVDPNRNFNVGFGGASTSGTPCSPIFKGDGAFSEAETIAIRDAVWKIRHRLKAYFTLHSFSQLWMCPYGYSTLPSDDFSEHMEVLREAVEAVEETHGMHYRYGPSASTLYLVSGTSSDWVYQEAGVKYSFAVELRDTGLFGFLLPRDQIVPTAEETWAGIRAAVLYISKQLKN